MEDLAVITALNQTGSFGENFVKVNEIYIYIYIYIYICYLPVKDRSVWKKTVNSVFKNAAFGLL